MLSIIVNHYKNPAMLKLSLRYVEEARRHLEERGVACEAIVTDSETIPETREMMKEHYPHIRFLEEEKNVGFAKSVNRAVSEATGEFLFIMNADIILADPTAIEKLLGYLGAHPDAGIAGPKLLNLNGTLQPSCFRFYTPLTILLRRTALGKTPWGKKKISEFTMKDTLGENPSSATPADWLMGSALLIRKSHLDKVGPLDESFFMYMEDVDWARRFWEQGFKVVYYPHAAMYHYHFQASRKRGGVMDILFNKYTRIHLLSAVKYFRKHGIRTPRYGS